MTQDFRTTKRRWIKLYPVESLNGSIRYQLTSAERGVWYDLLCFSSLCSNTGDISDRDGKAYPMAYIANRLNIQPPLLKSTIDKCIDEGRLLQDDNGLHIVNWSRYQSEYDRQKPYREAARKRANSVVDEKLARQKVHQEAVSGMTSEERQADAKRLGDQWDKDHADDPAFDENGNPLSDDNL